MGWKVLNSGTYTVPLPLLSEDEESLILELESYFREITRIKEMETPSQIKEELSSMLERVCAENGYELDAEQQRYLVDVSYLHIFGLGFFEFLLSDEDIEEIAVIGVGKPVYVYKVPDGWQECNVSITSSSYLMEVINKMASSTGRRITLQDPRLDTTLPDGSRLHASLPPVSEGELTIRKFRSESLSLRKLISFKGLSPEIASYLSMFMQGDFSLLVAGNTASGKTTLLNALFSFIPSSERIVITEETAEINPLQKHVVRLVANKEMGITLQDLVYDTLRMRPDRIVVGEIRNADEANALLDVLLAGQARGAYATFHGKSAGEALSRLKSFGISPLDINSIDVLLVQKRMLLYSSSKKTIEERRRLVEFSLVVDSQPVPLFTYALQNDGWKKHNANIAVDLLASRIGLSPSEVKSELKRRRELISRAPSEYLDFYAAIQGAFYGPP